MYSNVIFVILAVIYKYEVIGYNLIDTETSSTEEDQVKLAAIYEHEENGYINDTKTSSKADEIPSSMISVTDGLENMYSYLITTRCKPEILAKSNQSFSLDSITNNGDFNFVYVTGYVTIANATTEFHGDSEIGYRRSLALIDTSGKTTVQYYKLNEISPGVIGEIYQNTNSMGKTYTNSYKLIIQKYDEDLGVLEYIRCSDNGRKHSQDKYILVDACPTDPDSSMQKAVEFYQQDDSSGSGIQSLHPI